MCGREGRVRRRRRRGGGGIGKENRLSPVIKGKGNPRPEGGKGGAGEKG